MIRAQDLIVYRINNLVQLNGIEMRVVSIRNGGTFYCDFEKMYKLPVDYTKIDMRTKLRLLWYWLETRYAKLLRLFGVVRSTDCIPDGMYCYEYDEERNAKEPTDGYWIKTCKYYRSTPKTKGIACTYVGYMGFDPCLYDQCKICGVKD